MKSPTIIFCLAVAAALAACSPEATPPMPASVASSSSSPIVDLVPFGQEKKVNEKVLLSMSRAELRSSIGIGLDTRQAPEGKAYVVVEDVIHTPGIDAVALEPLPDLFLVDPTGQMFKENTDLAVAYAGEPDQKQRFVNGFNKPQAMLDAHIFEIPLGSFDPGAWHLQTGNGINFALK